VGLVEIALGGHTLSDSSGEHRANYECQVSITKKQMPVTLLQLSELMSALLDFKISGFQTIHGFQDCVISR
jgi:hypothetical protein